MIILAKANLNHDTIVLYNLKLQGVYRQITHATKIESLLEYICK